MGCLQASRSGILCAFIAVAMWPLPSRTLTAAPTARTPCATRTDTSTWLRINQVEMLATNSGSFAYDRSLGVSGFIYPRGSGSGAVFAAGLWFAAEVDGEFRAAVADYAQEYGPGPALPSGGWTDPENYRHRVYNVGRWDSRETSDDYAAWVDWPDSVPGAPPREGDGSPAILGDRMLWCVYNDLDPARHTSSAGGATPCEVEIRQSIFAFDRAGPEDRTIFLVFDLVHVGEESLDSAFVSIWCDPDLGGANDDLIGCDSTLALGYCYNGDDHDEVYGTRAPAIGILALEGTAPTPMAEKAAPRGSPDPVHDGVHPSSFNGYIGGADPEGAAVSYDLMRGLTLEGESRIDPETGRPTRWIYAGDPVTGDGWLNQHPGDHRMMLSWGPVRLAPGDTQRVAAALVVGQGTDRLSSLADLRGAAPRIRELYRNLHTPPDPVNTSGLHAKATDFGVLVTWWAVSDCPCLQFEVYRRGGGDGWRRISTVPVGEGPDFAFHDTSAQPGEVYEFAVEAVSNTGERERFGPVEARSRPASGLKIEAYPNPSPGRTEFLCRIPAEGEIHLDLYSVSGRRLGRVAEGRVPVGIIHIPWDGRIGGRRVSGVCYLRLEGPGGSASNRIVIVR